MSSNDKTRQKLMDTMRKTKSDSARKEPEADATVNAKPLDDKPLKKKAKKPAKTKVAGDTQNSVADPYQTKRRVWPD